MADGHDCSLGPAVKPQDDMSGDECRLWDDASIGKSQRGFTLLEIIVVVAIIAILAAYIAPQIAGRVDDARISKAKSDIRVLESAMELYKLDNFTYPEGSDGLESLVNKPSNAKNWRDGGYVKKLNKDPWGNEYQYRYPGSQAEFDIYSLGADAAVGGDGEAADIGNWNLDS